MIDKANDMYEPHYLKYGKGSFECRIQPISSAKILKKGEPSSELHRAP